MTVIMNFILIMKRKIYNILLVVKHHSFSDGDKRIADNTLLP